MKGGSQTDGKSTSSLLVNKQMEGAVASNNGKGNLHPGEDRKERRCGMAAAKGDVHVLPFRL